MFCPCVRLEIVSSFGFKIADMTRIVSLVSTLVFDMSTESLEFPVPLATGETHVQAYTHVQSKYKRNDIRN